MSVVLNPYINFDGNAREAIEFYRSVFDRKVNVMTVRDMHGVPTEPEEHRKVMHATLTAETGIVMMAADTPNGMDHQPFTGSSSLSGDDETTLRGYWDKLTDGGQV